MAQRAKKEPLTPPPVDYDRDESLTGYGARIRGERGTYKILFKETNKRTGVSWYVMWGGIKGNESYRHKYAKDIKLEGRRPRGTTL